MAVRVIGGGESLRLAMSSSSIAKSIRTSAGSPVYLTIDLSRVARRTPSTLARSGATVRAGLFLAGLFIRPLVACCKLYSLSRGGSHERQTRPPFPHASPECRRDSTRSVTRARAVPVGTRREQPRSHVYRTARAVPGASCDRHRWTAIYVRRGRRQATDLAHRLRRRTCAVR